MFLYRSVARSPSLSTEEDLSWLMIPSTSQCILLPETHTDLCQPQPILSIRQVSPLASPLASPLMSPYNSPNDPNGTSMGINTQKFLMLFLVTPAPQTLTLDFAAKVIHGIHQVEKTRLTRIRRLYDIANILQSLGLIRKVQVEYY